ncbi:molybdopterin-dependent oxidoreductase [Slackia piriformis]|uniref:molybdopterin-dependent oxidoreductase n=1 Tax=Slackia piriformis TaxID=626934 RepID=UPI002F94563E
MEESMAMQPEFFMKDGKLNRRTFIKGVGLVTVASAFGFGLQADEAIASQGEAPAGGEETSIHAVCTVNCTSRCHLHGTVRDGKIVRVEPGDMPGRPGYANACLRSMSYIQRLQDENARVMYPMKRIGERGSGEFERITWDEAIDTIAEKLNAVIEKDPRAASFYSFTGDLGKLSWEAPTRYAATIGATAWDIEGIMGDHGASMGMTMVFGTHRGAHDSRDYMNSNLIIIWGRNLADTHTSELRDYVAARKNGAKVIVIDPRQSSTAAMADEWIPINPQTDPALALGMMNWIISNDLHNKEKLASESVAPYLIRDDNGAYLRNAEGAYLVWDESINTAVAAPTAEEVRAGGVMPALSGSFNVEGVACKTAFDHLAESAKKYTPEYTAEICGITAETVVRLAKEYIEAQPAAIRMGQGMQRVWHSYAPFRTVATLAMVAGYIGVKGGGASHAGGTATTKPVAGYTGPVYNYSNWSNTGKKSELVKSSLIYSAAVDHSPVPIDFLWIANSNFINMSPDSNRVINEVIPAIDFIVTVDPWWTWTAKYSDIVLPACTYWEHWDMIDRSPWVMFNQPGIEPMGESKSDVEIMTLLAKKTGVAEYWDKTDEEWIREFVGTDHPAWADFDWDRDVVEQGIYGRSDADYSPGIVYANGNGYKTATKKFEFYTESMVDFDDEVPTWKPPVEDPREGELSKKYPLVYIQYHDRLNVHTQHILNPALTLVQDEPLLQMNPIDASARGIKHDDIVKVYNDRGDMTLRVFVTEGIVPGTVATQSGWTPDYFIDGCYQNLTHHTICDAEEAYSQTNTAFYDVLVEVAKA